MPRERRRTEGEKANNPTWWEVFLAPVIPGWFAKRMRDRDRYIYERDQETLQQRLYETDPENIKQQKNYNWLLYGGAGILVLIFVFIAYRLIGKKKKRK